VWQLTLTPGSETWTQLNPTGDTPPPTLYPVGVTTVENPPKMYVLGTVQNSPTGYNFVDGVWVLDLTPGAEKWTSLGSVQYRPETRFQAAVTYDPVGNNLLLSGGLDELTLRNDVWALTLP
jgi:hypothetical protein